MVFLVVGACGFIGSQFTEYAREKGHTVIGCDVLPRNERVEALFPNENEYWCTTEDDSFLSRCGHVDCMVLLAAKRPYKDFCFADYSFNVEIANKFMTLAMEHEIPNVVFASSKAVYSEGELPWKEDVVNKPSSLYGASKVAVEQLGLYYAHLGKMSFKALRFAQVIGAGERKGYLINTLIDNAIAKKTQTIYGDGSQCRHYVYVKDICAAILTAGEKQGISGVYNIGMKKSITNLELAEAVNRAFDNEGNLTHDYSLTMATNNDEMDTSKALEELGFKAGYEVYETMVDLAQSMKNE